MPQAKDGGREMKKSLPQSNAVHLTALPSRGTRFCLRLGAPYKIDRFAHKCSLFPPLAAVTFVARQRGRKRREQAPALPYKLPRSPNLSFCAIAKNLQQHMEYRQRNALPNGEKKKRRANTVCADCNGMPILRRNIKNCPSEKNSCNLRGTHI